MGFAKEFKEFALKGHMLDLAIGVVLGTAFGKVVSSLVTDIIMPPFGLLLGRIDFSALSIKFPVRGSTLPPVEIKYGLFVNSIISFLIIAFVIFLIIKSVNRWRTTPPTKAAETKECPECLMTVPIRAKKCGHCCSTFNL